MSERRKRGSRRADATGGAEQPPRPRADGEEAGGARAADHTEDGGFQPGLGLAALLYFALSLLYFIPALIPGRHIYGSDYLAGGFFFQEFVSAQLAAGHLPAWVPYIYGGLPLFANPGNTFYPFRFLVNWLFPVSRILPTIFVLQFTLAGLGTYLLARELEVRRWIALVAGIAFEFSGLAMSFVLAGQDGRIIVATLTPLTFFFLHRGIRTGRFGEFVGLAATLGFALLSFQIQMAYYLLLASGIWGIFCLIHLGYARRPGPLTKRVVLGLLAVAFAFGMASVNFLPFMHYVPAAGRPSGYKYSISYSMPPEETLGLAVPEQAGILQNYHGRSPFKEHTEYVGALLVALLFLGAVYDRKSRYWWFFLGLIAFELSMAYGGYTPIFRLYWSILPGAKKFRAPNLTFFLVSFSLAIMAALTMERLAVLRVEQAGGRGQRTKKGAGGGSSPFSSAWWVLGALLVATFVGAGLAGASGAPGHAQTARLLGYIRFGFFLALTAAALWAWLTGRLSPRFAAIALVLITAADLWVIDRKFFRTVPSPDTMFRADGTVDFLRSQPGPFRIWALPFPPGHTYAWAGTDYLMRFHIDQAGGEHSDPLLPYLQFAGKGEHSMVDWHNFLRHPGFMDMANIRYLIAGVQLKAPGLKEVHRGRTGVVYENITALPRAYLVPSVKLATPPEGAVDSMQQTDFDPRKMAMLYRAPPRPLPTGALVGSAHVDTEEPDSVVVTTSANREALLVLADNYYPDWTVRVDGRPATLLRADHAFRGVEVPAGQHQVTFRFEPRDLYEGFHIYLVCMALLGLYVVAVGVQTWRRRRPAVE